MPEAERLATGGLPIEKVAYGFDVEGVPDAWRVHALSIEEALSAPYLAELALVSEEAGADPGALIGRSCRLTMTRGPLARRLSGIVLSVEHAGHTHGHVLANVKVGPALAALAHQAGSRMFQGLTIPEIVAQVLTEGLQPYRRTVRKSLTRAYPQREYCLQYEESDLAFVTRLMADEGIFFWFDQSGEREEMVLADGNAACDPFADEATVGVHGPGAALADSEGLREFTWTEHIRPTAIMLRDFDWTRPALDLSARKKGGEAATPAEREVYAYSYASPLTLSDYGDGGRYVSDDGRAKARLRWEAEQAASQAGSGTGYVTRFAPGATFELSGGADLDRKYVITSVTHDGEAPEELVADRTIAGSGLRAAGAGGGPAGAGAGFGARERYRNRFTCIPADVPFRPARPAARPRIPGLQSALVVGPPGEEIHTDLHGRIRVRFPWDRQARGDETSSCWIRVAQVWSGPGWGFMFIPRIGMEVLVAFMEGDPDRPLVVGCAHNGENPTPYGLPGDKTRSTIKTLSSPGGNGFNELRFEDAAGHEEVFVHAQKDMNRVVLHDRTSNVGHDEAIVVGNDRTHQVGVDESITVGSNRKEAIGANETRQVGVNFTESIGANAAIDIGANKTESVRIACAETIGAAKALTIGAAYQVSVGAAMNETIGGLKAEEIVGAKLVNVGMASAENVGLKKTVAAGLDITESAGKNIALHAGESFHVTAGKKGTIEITDELTLKCGDALIKLKSNGDILIKGANINIKGSGDVHVKGANIGEN
jgi:type VI secretion system secreted protein VgrG